MSLLTIFGHKMAVCPFENNPKNLDLSFKTDLDVWDCFESKNPTV